VVTVVTRPRDKQIALSQSTYTLIQAPNQHNNFTLEAQGKNDVAETEKKGEICGFIVIKSFHASSTNIARSAIVRDSMRNSNQTSH
jgi:hypothetical protein